MGVRAQCPPIRSWFLNYTYLEEEDLIQEKQKGVGTLGEPGWHARTTRRVDESKLPMLCCSGASGNKGLLARACMHIRYQEIQEPVGAWVTA